MVATTAGGAILATHIIEPVAVVVQEVPGQHAAEPVALHIPLAGTQAAMPPPPALVGGAVVTMRAWHTLRPDEVTPQ